MGGGDLRQAIQDFRQLITHQPPPPRRAVPARWPIVSAPAGRSACRPAMSQRTSRDTGRGPLGPFRFSKQAEARSQSTLSSGWTDERLRTSRRNHAYVGLARCALALPDEPLASMRAMLSGDASARPGVPRDLDGLADEACILDILARNQHHEGAALRTDSTSPTSASLMKASRTGCRETPSCLGDFRFRQEIARPQLQLDDRLLERLVDAIAHRRLAQAGAVLVERIQLEGVRSC